MAASGSQFAQGLASVEIKREGVASGLNSAVARTGGLIATAVASVALRRARDDACMRLPGRAPCGSRGRSQFGTMRVLMGAHSRSAARVRSDNCTGVFSPLSLYLIRSY